MLKFSNFRCHGNRGRFDVNFNDSDKLLDLENPVCCNVHGSISYISRVLANFVLKFPNFRYHGNRGSEINFNHTVNLLDLENPLFGTTSMALSLVQAEF